MWTYAHVPQGYPGDATDEMIDLGTMPSAMLDALWPNRLRQR
ncbi:hypothetical protein [Mycolicibacterium thermoresistibile]